MDNRLTVGDWVIIDDGMVGEVWYIHTYQPAIIDVRVEWDRSPKAGFETIRTATHKITKITKEVADIIGSV